MSNDSFFIDLQDAKDGDEQALNQLMERFRHVVDGECRRIKLPAADLSQSDLSQESWLRVWQKLDSFECSENGEAAPRLFAGWLRTTARNIAHDVVRKRQAQKRNPDAPIVPIDGSINVVEQKGTKNLTPSKEIANREEVSIVEKAIRELTDPISQQVIRLYFERGLSFEEIATELELTKDQIRYRFSSRLKTLLRIFFQRLVQHTM